MAKRPAAEFERDLEAVFEDRARDFSPELRALLEQLWLEGVGEGRVLERRAAFKRPAARPLDGFQSPGLFESQLERPSRASGSQLDQGNITLEEVCQVARELGIKFPNLRTSGNRPLGIEIMGTFAGTGDECPLNSQPTTSRSSPRSSTRAISRFSGTGSTDPEASGKG